MEQEKLLRLLQNREFEHVSGNKTIKTGMCGCLLQLTEIYLNLLRRKILARIYLTGLNAVPPVQILPLRERGDNCAAEVDCRGVLEPFLKKVRPGIGK